jgi:hypothetical protein
VALIERLQDPLLGGRIVFAPLFLPAGERPEGRQFGPQQTVAATCSPAPCGSPSLLRSWHLKQRLEPLFAADGTHKDRQWTLRNMIGATGGIRREKIVMGAVEFDKVTTPEPDQQAILDYLKVRL